MAKQICPDIDPPDAPVFHAFSYTRRAPAVPPSFVVAGSGDGLDFEMDCRAVHGEAVVLS